MKPIRLVSVLGLRAITVTVLCAVSLVVLAISASDGGVTTPPAAAQAPDLQSSADVTADFQAPDVACAPGSLPAPPPLGSDAKLGDTGCAPVVDRRAAFSAPETPVDAEGHFKDAELKGRGVAGDPPPNPGIRDAGMNYTPGQLTVTYSSTFSSYIEVYPENIAYEWDSDPEEVSGYYITATNRTQKGVEFLFRIRESNFDPSEEKGWLMIYDWSCSVAYPCDNGSTGIGEPNAFVRAWPLLDVPCWYLMSQDNTGHYVNYVYFRNSTWIVEPRNPPADPPLWRNAVSVWNHCTLQYDGVYSHDFAVNQLDCSAVYCQAGRWAGIAERFPESSTKPPVMLKMGFHHQSLEYDAQSTDILPSNSDFKDPSTIAPFWELYSLWSNTTWEAGTYQDDDGDDIPNSSDPDIDGDGVPNSLEIICGATAPPGYTPEAHPYRIPERIDNVYAGEDDDGDGLVDEALPPAAATDDCDQDGYSGVAEQYIFSRATNVDDQAACAETTAFNDEENDRWPPDLNDDRKVSLSDALAFGPYFNMPVPPAPPRYDLNQDGIVSLSDVLGMAPVFNTFCSLPPV